MIRSLYIALGWSVYLCINESFEKSLNATPCAPKMPWHGSHPTDRNEHQGHGNMDFDPLARPILFVPVGVEGVPIDIRSFELFPPLDPHDQNNDGQAG